jgi:DNA-binding LacI/PurR family transcriptional regulator
MKALTFDRPTNRFNLMTDPREEKPTIYDVARLAGLSIATVSRVINSPDQVNETTKNKVLQIIDEIGYIPKAEARARAIRGTRRIGVLTPFFTAPSFVERLRGIAFVIGNTNFELIVYTVDSMLRLQDYLVSLALTRNLDGLIIMSLPFSETDAKRLIAHQVKTVVIEFEQEFFSSVKIDNTGGGKIAARYLTGMGHRRLGFIGEINPPEYAIRPALARLNGFEEGLAEDNIQLPDELICSSPIDKESSLQSACELLHRAERPTAIFAAADIQAMAVIKAAKEMGLRIPLDLAILGFDGLEVADYVGLTTVDQSLEATGRIAAELLLAQISDSRRSVQHVSVPLKIIERETV